MPFRLVEHTADLALEIEAPTLAALYGEALRGLTDCVTDLEAVEPRVERTLTARAADRELLLVEWLSEAVWAFESRGELYREASVALDERPGEIALRARLRGEPFDAGRHPLRVLIKGVTYHRLQIEEREGGWWGRVVLDI